MNLDSVLPEMALQELQGKTLGERRKHYNELVKKAIDGGHKIQAEDFNPADDAVKNLMKIDVAGKNRNVEYILNILQGDDMLYVSRAIKQSKWLFTDRQYSHIINPHYLYTQLVPNMTSKACAKLLLHIRIHLKDADRVEDFYNFIKEKDIHAALSWLPHCSLPIIQVEVEKHYTKIDSHLLKRLCEKSITILEIVIKYCRDPYDKRNMLENNIFLLKRETEKFLDILERVPHPYSMPYFRSTAKLTKIVMKNCPQRILDKFEKYFDRFIDLHTFVKYLKPEEIEDFIFKVAENENMPYMLQYDNLSIFVSHLPIEGRFDFVKKFLIQKRNEEVNEDTKTEDCVLLRSLANTTDRYQWYRFAPFNVAFAYLTKLIRANSAPRKRIAIFSILLSSANGNPQHIQSILQYYNDRYVNEPFKLKKLFVNMLLTQTDPYRFNEAAWNTLNNLFYSMEVYDESENNVQSCIEAIILYKLLHNEKIPEIIEKKFEFQYMESVQKKLTDEERNKVFDFLYKTLESKIKNINISSEIEFTETVDLLENVQTLLTTWNKNLIEYPYFQDKVKELIKLKSDHLWNANLSTLYTRNKSWRRIMFEESLMLSPSEETCYNVLKHDPELMLHNKSAIEQLRRDDNVSLRRVLRSLRVYWPQTLAADWMAWYLSSLDQPGANKSVIRGLCILASQQQLNDIFKKCAPTESKINWSERDEVVLNRRKHIARNMHVSRPHPSPDLVLLYAKGDYLPFALPSINAVFDNMSAVQTRENVFKLLDAPVSHKKHGIRFAATKLEPKELKRVFQDIWIRTKNPTVRAVLFKQTYDLLCRQSNPTMIQEIWELLNNFIDNLSTQENKKIYEPLTKNYKAIPRLVRGKFFMQSFKFLISLPPHKLKECANDVDVDYLLKHMTDLIEHLDPEFVKDILNESVDKIFTADTYRHSKLMAAYLLCAKDVESQTEKYMKVLFPVLERAFKLWDKWYVYRNVKELLYQLMMSFHTMTFEKKMVFPTKLFSDIQIELDTKLPFEYNYELQTSWKLFSTYVRSLEKHKETLDTLQFDEDEEPLYKYESYGCYYIKLKKKWNEVYIKALPEFSKMCLGYLKEDVNKYFPTIYKVFAKSLETAFDNINTLVYLVCLESLLVDKELIPSFLVVLENTPGYFCCYDYCNLCRDDLKEYEKIKDRIREKIILNSSPEIRYNL